MICEAFQKAEMKGKDVERKVKFKMFPVLEMFTIFDLNQRGKTFDQDFGQEN